MQNSEQNNVSKLFETTLDTYGQMICLACNLMRAPFSLAPTLPGQGDLFDADDAPPAGSKLTGPEGAADFNAHAREALARYQHRNRPVRSVNHFNDIDPDRDSPANFGV